MLIPPHTRVYAFNGHPVTISVTTGHGTDEPYPRSIQCPQCGLPWVINQAIVFMATYNVRRTIVDGAELVRSY